MKIVERVPYGKRGDGSLIRYEGVSTWFSVYCQRGAEHRRTTGQADFKAAKKKHKEFLDKLAAERQGHKPMPTPTAARVTVGDLLDALETDFRLRGVKWWAQAKYHAVAIREWFGDTRASTLTAADVDRYVEVRLAKQVSPASVNRQTGLLAQALRLAHERDMLTSVIAVRRLPERNARQGFLERADLDKVVAALPDYLQDFTRFAYVTAWRRGELITLRWSDVDRSGGVIRLRPDAAKNGHGRTVAIEGDLHAIIERRWQSRQLKGPGGSVRVVEHVFHRMGRPVGDFRKAWAQACIEAGLYRVARTNSDGSEKMVPIRLFHDLRRSGVRNMIRAGVPERVAMEISGHRTRSIFDRYNIVSEADLRTAMQRTSAYINSQPTQSTVTLRRPITAVEAR
jgi:integrase